MQNQRSDVHSYKKIKRIKQRVGVTSDELSIKYMYIVYIEYLLVCLLQKQKLYACMQPVESVSFNF